MPVLQGLVYGFQIGGLVVLLISGILALVGWLSRATQLWHERKPEEELRATFGHRIVLALEFFIAADIIASIQAPTFQELAKLGIIVVIRTILHYSLR